jgi:hypothetical protein
MNLTAESYLVRGMTPDERAAFDVLMGTPAPRWPGLLASYVRGTPVSALGDVAAEWVKTMPAGYRGVPE